MHRLACLLIFGMGLVLGVTQQAQSQSDFSVTDTQVTYLFGAEITIQAVIQSVSPIKSAKVFLMSEGNSQPESGEVLLGENGEVYFHYEITGVELRAFTEVLYWFEITTDASEVMTSPSFTFYYTDNRFAWQTIEQAPFRVHWYMEREDLGQEVLDAVQGGLTRIQSFFPVETPVSLDIYVYSTAQDLQTALGGSRKGLISGHADPDLGVVLIASSPDIGQTLELQRNVFHELAHVLLYNYLDGEGYGRLPLWLNEGLASVVEPQPNPDYIYLLEVAHKEETLLPISSLCASFPQDAHSRVLAYAQSTSFVNYIQSRYSAEGIQKLLEAYKKGESCENAPQVALGTSLNQLEKEWRLETFNESMFLGNLISMLPWIVLLVVILATPLGMMVSTKIKKRRTYAGGR
ncbi:MAG: peptidase MA family metallohydrolase [Chloroflexota bacterium]